MPERSFVYTTHAVETLAHRAIEPGWVEAAVLAPDAEEPDPVYPERTRAYRAVPERGGRILRVVYAQDGSTCRIITAFLDRGRKRSGT
ncbi:DUF4258 domain-containing protein [Methylobacterium trifolii]|uniref:DUF4258 domain-containing protein n=1 Tax=Methylobacterium trifolii TaxID=1003092 RepID=UPI001EDD3172|nr:DUF4258 domain-containing protein [Methylobacterium trifolii]